MFRKFDFLVFGSTQHMLRGCSCLCISDLEILFKKISGRSNAGVSWYSRIWVEEQRLRRGTRNKESRTARVKCEQCSLSLTQSVQYTSPHKITGTFVMCHYHLQLSRHNHFKEWPWTKWRLDLTPKKAPERGKRNVVLISCCSTDLAQPSKKSRWPVFLSLWRWPNWHKEGSWPSSDQNQYKWNPNIGKISEVYSMHLIPVSWPFL